MARIISSYGFALLALATILPTQAIASDTYGPAKGTTSRYWDCCKPSCGWADKGKFVNSIPVGTCDAKGNPLTDFNAGTGCNGGDSRPCANNVPWAVNDTFSYGFAGVHTLGGEESTWCCACYELTFTTGPAKGKKMVIQSTNTDYEDDTVNRFTFGIPGGNITAEGGAGCLSQYGITADNDKKQLVINEKEDCKNLPENLRKGCEWRFDWFGNAEFPDVEYTRVQCPKALTDITGCVREDETTFLEKAESERKEGGSTSAASFSSISLSALLLSSLTWALQ